VYLIAGSFMTLIIQMAQRTNSVVPRKNKKKDYLLIIVIAIFGATIAPSLYFFGLNQTTASHAAVLSNGEMAFTVLFAIILFKERLRKIGYFGVILILTGVVTISMVTNNIGGNNSIQFKSFANIAVGDVFIIGSTVFWAIDNNISKIVTQRGVSVTRIVQMKSLIGGLILSIIVYLTHIPININILQIPNILLLGIGGFAASLFFFLNSLRKIGTVRTIVIFSISSVFGIIFARLFLNEYIELYQTLIAIGIMLFGVYLINKKKE